MSNLLMKVWNETFSICFVGMIPPQIHLILFGTCLEIIKAFDGSIFILTNWLAVHLLHSTSYAVHNREQFKCNILFKICVATFMQSLQHKRPAVNFRPKPQTSHLSLVSESCQKQAACVSFYFAYHSRQNRSGA